MNRSDVVIIGIQVLLLETVLVLSGSIKMPEVTAGALVILSVGSMLAQLTVYRRECFLKVGAVVALACTAVAQTMIALLIGRGFAFGSYSDDFYAVVAWLTALIALPGIRHIANVQIRTLWKSAAMAWAVFGGLLWLAAAYWNNQPAAFYVGLVIELTLLFICKSWFRLPFLAVQTANTLILLLIGIPITDAFVRPTYRLGKTPAACEKYYSYEMAKKDPVAFGHWWQYFDRQCSQLFTHILIKDRDGAIRFRLRPGSHGTLLQSKISINSQGFRGKEIPAEKADAYRIVTLGESTTFGFTLNAEDRPWPELLEEMIRDRLKPRRPVEVINAGVPAATLPSNVKRLPVEILPVKPDMIISYHGFNGFWLLDKALPPVDGPCPPAYRQRPIKLLADAEYRLRVMHYKQEQLPRTSSGLPGFSDPMQTEYAQAYQELIRIAETNKIRLVLADYSMAVNNQSDPGVVAFYRGGFPLVALLIHANMIHTGMVKRLTEQHPEVCFVDTHPGLDGEHRKFIDVMHFAAAGERQMAETMFSGIRKTLEADLGVPARGPASGKETADKRQRFMLTDRNVPTLCLTAPAQTKRGPSK